MTDNTKGKKKTTKRKDAEEMIFEVWQVITPISPDDEFDGFNHWPPFSITKPEKNLSEVCATKYGCGDFVALQLAESRAGLPLSHWVIKVRSLDLHNAVCVHPDDEYLAIVREQYTSAGTIPAELFYRGREAALTSLCLSELKEPKVKESKETLPVKRAKELIRHYGPRSKGKVIARLITEAKKLWPEENFVSKPEAVEVNAKAAYESAKRALRGRGEQRKANRTSRKTRRT